MRQWTDSGINSYDGRSFFRARDGQITFGDLAAASQRMACVRVKLVHMGFAASE